MAITCASSSTSTSYTQRWGGKIHDQPTSWPGPIVSMTSGPVGRVDLQRDLPGPQHEELVGRIVLRREELPDLDDAVAAATGHEVEVPRLQAGQHRLHRQQVADRRRSHCWLLAAHGRAPLR